MMSSDTDGPDVRHRFCVSAKAQSHTFLMLFTHHYTITPLLTGCGGSLFYVERNFFGESIRMTFLDFIGDVMDRGIIRVNIFYTIPIFA